MKYLHIMRDKMRVINVIKYSNTSHRLLDFEDKTFLKNDSYNKGWKDKFIKKVNNKKKKYTDIFSHKK